MGKYRSRFEIIADILNVASDGIRKTAIMRRTNLSYRMLQKYLSLLLIQDLLISRGRWFVTTTKGRKFIELFSKWKLQKNSLDETVNQLKEIVGVEE